jgi:uncharacterized protein with von Willebrand factor type A (vWA) domain
MANTTYFPDAELDKLNNKYPIATSKNIKQHIASEVKKWKRKVKRWLDVDNPFYDNQQNLQIAKDSLEQKQASLQNITDDLTHFKELSKQTKSNDDFKFWDKDLKQLSKQYNDFNNKETSETTQNKQEKLILLQEKHNKTNKTNSKKISKVEQEKQEKQKRQEKLENIKADSLISRTLLQEKWAELSTKEHTKWEINAIEKYRNKLLKELENYLDKLQKLSEALADLSLDSGVLFDLAKGNLSLSDIADLQKWASYIANDNGVKKLCDIMGRLRTAEESKHQELINHSKIINEFIPDINSKEEIVGVHLGRDIERALPQELALLADDETKILFDLKLVESGLMCFNMEGVKQKETIINTQKLHQITTKEGLGAIIICVDTSGSMQGSPETVAKAITLFMATRAIKQNRKCLLINFSTGIEVFDLSANIGIKHVIKFLKKSFNGGTDASPALNHSVDLMQKDDYKKADLLMISDFIMPKLPKELQEKIRLIKQNKNKFYSLAIGNMFLEKTIGSIFDDEWVYNPNNSSVKLIQTMADKIII